jgi:NAD(P)-dependent dehydrogenase (short-subunit alcohol dehydrogenase family)
MNGKVCVVTGATSGIGKATAAALSGLGAQVVLVGRDRGRAEATAAELRAAGAVARRLEGTGATANCAHPGVVRTGFGREARLPLRVGLTIARPFLLSPERGASTIVYLASSPEVATATGGYYVKQQRREPSAAARDQDAARRLWRLSEELTGLTQGSQPEVR